MIKLTLRRSSIYIIQLIIYYNIRRIIKGIITKKFGFNSSLSFTFLMHFGELFGGLSVYFYRITFLRENKKKKKKSEFLMEKVVKEDKKMNRIDGYPKIALLLFFTAFFDFIEYLILSFFVPRLAEVSPTADLRLNAVSTISSAFAFKYALRLRIEKHQYFALTIIGISIVLLSIVEFIYQKGVALFGELFLAYIITYLAIIFMSFTDLIEKYLTYFDFMEPMLILTFEAIFGIILVTITSFFQNYSFEEIIDLYNKLETGEFVLFIFLLFVYFALCAGINVYRVFCTAIYSPMYRSISYYFLSPVMIIYTYFFEDDFLYEGKPNVFYLIFNIILAIIILFFGAVYNEFLILYCCGLEYETHNEISKRSSNIELVDLKHIYFDINEKNEDDDGEHSEKTYDNIISRDETLVVEDKEYLFKIGSHNNMSKK